MIQNSNQSEREQEHNASRFTQIRLKIQIPQSEYQNLILSHLTSDYGVKVRIAALLDVNAQECGWFDVQLHGTSEQLDNALLHLSDLALHETGMIVQLHSSTKDGFRQRFAPIKGLSQRKPQMSQNQNAAENSNPPRLAQTRLRIQIPQSYHQDPIISHLTSHYGLEVNIAAALLDAKALGGGWFDLQLRGTQEQIDSALVYLSDLNVQFWHEESEQDGW